MGTKNKLKELENQIDKLIVAVEEQKVKHLVYGLTGDLREDNGYISALKFVKLLLNTNLRIDKKGAQANETVPKTQLIM